jgi:hypothetical protein
MTKRIGYEMAVIIGNIPVIIAIFGVILSMSTVISGKVLVATTGTPVITAKPGYGCCSYYSSLVDLIKIISKSRRPHGKGIA